MRDVHGVSADNIIKAKVRSVVGCTLDRHGQGGGFERECIRNLVANRSRAREDAQKQRNPADSTRQQKRYGNVKTLRSAHVGGKVCTKYFAPNIPAQHLSAPATISGGRFTFGGRFGFSAPSLIEFLGLVGACWSLLELCWRESFAPSAEISSTCCSRAQPE